MITALKLGACAGAVAAATGLFHQPPKTTAQPPAASQPAASTPRQLTEDDCREALERLRSIRHEINTIETRIDNAQKALAATKGEARLDECVKIINELADDSKLIRQKVLVSEALSQGHILEHIRSAKDFQDLQHDLNRCVMALHFARVSKDLDDSENAPKKK